MLFSDEGVEFFEEDRIIIVVFVNYVIVSLFFFLVLNESFLFESKTKIIKFRDILIENRFFPFIKFPQNPELQFPFKLVRQAKETYLIKTSLQGEFVRVEIYRRLKNELTRQINGGAIYDSLMNNVIPEIQSVK